MTSADPGEPAVARGVERSAFLAKAGWAEGVIEPLAADASFRRYFRIRRGAASVILMDAPPLREDVRPFVFVAGVLRQLGYSAPSVLAEDAQRGFLLLEDLGERTYTRVLDAGGSETPLYAMAIDLLADLHRRFRPVAGLPEYTDEKLLAEAGLFVDWVMPQASPTLREDYLERWRAILPLARALPESLVLRDYHVDNLMLLDRPGLASCGLLDFQDAVIGPLAYDVVSLLEDARRDVAETVRLAMLQRYLDAAPLLDPAAFETAIAVLGGQRHAKVIGIFRRLAERDGKPGYLRHLPRLWRLLDRSCGHPAMAPIAAFLSEHVPAERRG